LCVRLHRGQAHSPGAFGGGRTLTPPPSGETCRLVAQVSKPAVSPTSKSAGCWKTHGPRVWKPATQQTWKSALRWLCQDAPFGGGTRDSRGPDACRIGLPWTLTLPK